MLQYDIIGELKTYADARSYGFLSGNKFYQNYEATIGQFSNGQYIIAVDFNAKPEFNLSKVDSITYTGFIMLGLKHDNDGLVNTPDENFHDGTPANLDETFYQKYVRRLKDLYTLLSAFIITFACDNELDILSCDMSPVINDLDDNIDFVKAEISFSDEIFNG